jgi:hypothetical protein
MWTTCQKYFCRQGFQHPLREFCLTLTTIIKLKGCRVRHIGQKYFAA